jgi:hypothetical protein
VKFLIPLVMAVLVASGAAPRPNNNELNGRFGEGFASLRTEHWVIFYSTTEEEARQVGESLERTRTVFVESFSRLGIKLDEPSRPLKCELYQDLSSYNDRMKSLGRSRDAPSFGWYSRATNRLILIKQDVEEIMGLKISLVWAAAHEGAHQLSFNLGLLERGKNYPPWLVEGVAGAFETTDPKAEFGPFSGYVTQKVRIIQEYVERSDYAPILELSEMRRTPSSSLRDRFENIPKERVQIYGQGASLVIYLITHRPEEFMTYVEDLTSGPNSGGEPNRWRAAFKVAFGDVGALESDWKRWLLELDPDS